MPIIPVILSGGSGTRLWPLSRPETPKQLLALFERETMLQVTARRTHGLDRFTAPLIVANAAHAALIDEQFAAIDVVPQAILLEPAARNTAPAIALAALAAEDPSSPLLVMPSDHIIGDVAAFHAAVETALPLVEQGWLATFGIAPEAPETGYGWIAIGEALRDGVHRVDSFVEKPPRERAEAMFASGNFAWNGGIFLFRADAYLAQLEQHAPAMLDAAKRAMAIAKRDGVKITPDAQAFAASPSDSIDYAVMERAERVAVVPVRMGWSDVGSWDAMYAARVRDENGNACHGDVLAIDTHGCLVHSAKARVAMIGVDDLIVVADGDDILILPRGRSQEVKQILVARKY